MSFQVTRPNGTKSNAIVEVIDIDRHNYLIIKLRGVKVCYLKLYQFEQL